jgi:hypothetical protein
MKKNENKGYENAVALTNNGKSISFVYFLKFKSIVMKSNIFVRALLFTGITTGVFASCSKEKMEETGSENKATVTSTTGKLAFQSDQAGSITGQVKPVTTKAKMVLYDTHGNFYGPYYSDRTTGNFKIPVPVAGTYKLVIEYPGVSSNAPSDPVASVVTVSFEVDVTSGTMTDLGVIYL